MVPFHECWVQTQFKDEKNINKMLNKLSERVGKSAHWLSDLVDELMASPDTPQIPECNYENVAEALAELESFHSEIFPEHSTPEEEEGEECIQHEKNDFEYDVTDSELVECMECWEEQQIGNAIEMLDYEYLLNDKVSQM